MIDIQSLFYLASVYLLFAAWWWHSVRVRARREGKTALSDMAYHANRFYFGAFVWGTLLYAGVRAWIAFISWLG